MVLMVLATTIATTAILRLVPASQLHEFAEHAWYDFVTSSDFRTNRRVI
jgi:hypothetical protein